MEINGLSTLDLIRKVKDAIFMNGQDVTRRSGSWCMMKKPETHMLELHNVTLTLASSLYRWNTLLSRGILVETLDYFLGCNPGYVTEWYKIYKEFSAETGKLPYTYGERIFSGMNQWDRVVDLLTMHPTTRQASIIVQRPIDRVNIFVPCTYVLHFQVGEDGLLGMTSVMRSQDAFRGLPMDLFAWTMFHEQMSIATGLPLGKYTHFVCNLHYYERDTKVVGPALKEAEEPAIERRPADLLTRKEKVKAHTKLMEIVFCLEDRKLEVNELTWFLSGEENYWKDYLWLAGYGELQESGIERYKLIRDSSIVPVGQ